MMNIISKIAQKPSDKTIRITRILFALVLLLTIIFGWPVTRTEFGLPEYIKYILYVFPLIGLIRGIFDPGVFRKKIWKWTIFGIGVTMIVLSLFVIEDKDIIPNTPAVVENTGSLNLADLGKVDPISTPFTLPADNLFGLYGFILMIVGLLLNSKNITIKNERYGEIVKKIRV